MQLPGEVYHHTPVSAEDAMAVVKDCVNQNLHLNFCLNDELFVSEKNKWSELYEARTGCSRYTDRGLAQVGR